MVVQNVRCTLQSDESETENNILLSLLVLSYLLFSYYALGGWWNSFVGTLLILFFSYLIWKKDFLKVSGLQINPVIAVKSILLAGVIPVVAFLLMSYLGAKHDVKISTGNWQNYFHTVFYVLNEEIVVGAILLFVMIRKWKLSPLFASVLLAVFFALFHLVFYKWIFLDKENLGWMTLSTLFLVGFVRNSLILQTGHIGYSWALHFGWMALMFGSRHLDTISDSPLSEHGRFNLYLGSFEMLFIALLMSGLILIMWKKRGPVIWKS